MQASHGLIALLGYAALALASPKDPALTDETYLRQQAARSRAQAREITRLREDKRKEFLDRSRIGGDGDSCLAYAVETGDCPISAAEFDRGLLSHFPDSLEFQSEESLALKASQARRSVFEQLIDRAFLQAYQPEDSQRSTDPGAGKIRGKTSGEDRGIFEGSDMPTLLAAFPEIRVRVVAASDSAWLATRENLRGILPITLSARELPDSIAMLLSHYRRGKWTPIRKVPFGYLTCSWLDTLPAPERLMKIRFHPDPSVSKSARKDRTKAIDSLRTHREWCLDEDTLDLSLRMAPALRGQAQEPGPAWLLANSAVLPAAVKSRLWGKFDHGTLDTLGPIRSDYGTWMFALSSRGIKPGKTLDSIACLARAEAKLGKEEAAKRIRSDWEVMRSKSGSDRSGEARTALLEQLSRQGAEPESTYHKLRERWVSRSLRFTRDLGLTTTP